MKHLVLPLLSILASMTYQKEALSQMLEMKLRSPVRTWAGSELCLCPYDQVVTVGLSLTFPDEVILVVAFLLGSELEVVNQPATWEIQNLMDNEPLQQLSVNAEN